MVEIDSVTNGIDIICSHRFVLTDPQWSRRVWCKYIAVYANCTKMKIYSLAPFKMVVAGMYVCSFHTANKSHDERKSRQLTFQHSMND